MWGSLGIYCFVGCDCAIQLVLHENKLLSLFIECSKHIHTLKVCLGNLIQFIWKRVQLIKRAKKVIEVIFLGLFDVSPVIHPAKRARKINLIPIAIAMSDGFLCVRIVLN